MGLAGISLKNRMLILLTVWFIIYISLGVYASCEMNHLNEITGKVYDCPFIISNAVKNIRLNLLKIYQDMKNIMLQPEEIKFDLQLAEILAAEHEIFKNLDIMQDRHSCDVIYDLEPKIRSQYVLYSVKRQEAIGLVMLGLFFYLNGDIIKSIRILRDAIEVSTVTGELTETSLHSKNEITDIADGYNQLVRKLRELFWLEDGQNMPNRCLDGCGTKQELAEKSLQFLAERLEAGLGVLYLYNTKKKQLNLAAEYSNTKSNGFPSVVLPGEGVVGQAALERKPILLKETGDVTIQTGTVAFQPKSTYTFPFHHNGKLYGVMELAFQQSFTPFQEKFIALSSEIIAIKLNNVLQNEQIRELLELTEQAHAEIEETARELQAANKSLEEQKEKLQKQTDELLWMPTFSRRKG